VRLHSFPFSLVKCLLPSSTRPRLLRQSSVGGVALHLCRYPISRSTCPSGWPGRPVSTRSASTVATTRPFVIASATPSLYRQSVRSATATVGEKMAYVRCGLSTTRTICARWIFITTDLIAVDEILHKAAHCVLRLAIIMPKDKNLVYIECSTDYFVVFFSMISHF